MLTCTLARGRGGLVQLQAARATEYLQHRVSADRTAELKFKGVWVPSRLPARSPATGQEPGAELTGTPTLRPAIFLNRDAVAVVTTSLLARVLGSRAASRQKAGSFLSPPRAVPVWAVISSSESPREPTETSALTQVTSPQPGGEKGF